MWPLGDVGKPTGGWETNGVPHFKGVAPLRCGSAGGGTNGGEVLSAAFRH